MSPGNCEKWTWATEPRTGSAKEVSPTEKRDPENMNWHTECWDDEWKEQGDSRGSITIVCGYAPQAGCEEEEKNVFWRQLDQVIMEIPENERVIVGVDLNGHVGRRRCGEERVHG
ncbi:hypothetical protein J437_LFUL006630 [Ladona fulva]|uniref:Uncharacterized protein n=1 Tax=Ladona fulva TaxID=123851 RepID=A0A8K0KGW3_LADFU|nr:hypothetical protein J437_LFUL006630 [Ladona fulva]